MNILITGAFGFVGTNLSKSIKTAFKHRLIAVDVVEPARHDYDAYYRWDDLEKIKEQEIDVVIHLAGKAHDTKNTAEEKAYFDINLGLTRTIFNAFLKSDATKFIHFSSVKAVADSVRGDFLTEEAEPAPGTPYGRSKLEAERYIERRMEEWEREGARERGRDKDKDKETERLGDEEKERRGVLETGRVGEKRRTERGRDGETERGRDGETERGGEEEKGRTDKKIYILRPCMIHGPGNRGNLNLLYKLVSKGIPWPLGAFENRRSFTSVDNLSFVIHQLLERNIAPGIYQVADDEPLSTNRLIELIAESGGRQARIWKMNPNIVRRLAGMGDALHLPLNSERLKKLTESYVVSNSKIKKALGIEKMPHTGEEGMRRTLGAF